MKSLRNTEFLQEDRAMPGAVVCVTGASRGIGAAVARAFAGAGAHLALIARSNGVEDVAAECGGPDRAMAFRADVSRYSDVEAAVEETCRRWGRIDVLVNAAAILGSTGDFWSSDPAAWASAIEANLIGTYHTMRAAIPGMIAWGGGKVINFAGGGAAYGYPRFSAYASSKVAVVRLTETVALETRRFNIQANVIAPGAIETGMLAEVRAAGGEVRSTGTMDQPVSLVLFLASRDSDHLTGRFIHAKDDYRSWQTLPEDMYTLRRIQA